MHNHGNLHTRSIVTHNTRSTVNILLSNTSSSAEALGAIQSGLEILYILGAPLRAKKNSGAKKNKKEGNEKRRKREKRKERRKGVKRKERRKREKRKERRKKKPKRG